jgi:MFS family permease
MSTLIPLALAQFIATYAGSNMNVAISSIAADLGTTIQGVQLTISLFTLVMAAFMIPGSKLTDIWGRKRCFILGMIVYGLGAIIGALSPNLTVLIMGYSIFEGLGSALMIPPIYILFTVSSPDLKSRARAFGIVSAMAGVGAAAGPLLGGFITSTISWRASFIVQFLMVILIIILGRRIVDAGIQGEKPAFDILGAISSALGLSFIVLGILQAGNYGWFTSDKDYVLGNVVIIPQGSLSPVWLYIGLGTLTLTWFFYHIIHREKRKQQPLISIRMFKNRTSNLGLICQNVQWLVLQGSFFVISVYLQTVRGFNAIQTGLVLTAATIGIVLSSGFSGVFARKYSQRLLIRSGFIINAFGTILLLAFARATSSVFVFLPGLFLMGVGIGVMLTFSVNIVQSSFLEKDQGEISGLSRSISNLGSSLGVAIVGTVLVSARATANPNLNYFDALVVMLIIGLIGLAAALLLPRTPVGTVQPQIAGETPLTRDAPKPDPSRR